MYICVYTCISAHFGSGMNCVLKAHSSMLTERSCHTERQGQQAHKTNNQALLRPCTVPITEYSYNTIWINININNYWMLYNIGLNRALYRTIYCPCYWPFLGMNSCFHAIFGMVGVNRDSALRTEKERKGQ